MAKKRTYTVSKLKQLLRDIGEATLQRGEPVLRSTTIKNANGFGRTFYSKFGKGRENMERIARLIRKVDSKYNKIVYEPYERAPRNLKILGEDEKQIIENALIELMAENEDAKRVPRAIVQEVQKRLTKLGYERSEGSVDYQVNKVWQGEYIDYSAYMPKKIFHTHRADKLEQHIHSAIQELEEKEEPDLHELIDYKTERIKKRDFLKGKLPPGHQKLLAYLIDRENYTRLLGEDVELIAADLRKEDTDEELFKAFEERLKNLEGRLNDDEADFVDGWARCDLIYKRKNGTYVIVEIKQRALNRKPTPKIPHRKVYINEDGKQVTEDIKDVEIETPRNQNATHSLQQIGGYQGGLLIGIRKRDSDNKNNPDHVARKTPIESNLVAYQIQSDFFDYLRNAEGFGASVVSKQEVDEYIDRKIHGANKKQKKSKVEEKAKEIIEEKTRGREIRVGKTQEPIKQQIKTETKTPQTNIPIPVPTNNLPVDSNSFFATESFSMAYILGSMPTGAQIGVYDPAKNIVRLDVASIKPHLRINPYIRDIKEIHILYALSESNGISSKINEYISMGILREGNVTQEEVKGAIDYEIKRRHSENSKNNRKAKKRSRRGQ